MHYTQQKWLKLQIEN